MRMIAAIDCPSSGGSPCSGHSFNNPLHRLCVIVGRAKIPGLAESRAVFVQALCKHQVASHRLEYVLPWTRCLGIADFENFSAGEGPEDIGYQAVLRPVAAANHIAGARRRDRNVVFRKSLWIEEGIAVCADEKLGACLAIAVRIVTAQWIVLSIRPYPLAVFVTLVRC